MAKEVAEKKVISAGKAFEQIEEMFGSGEILHPEEIAFDVDVIKTGSPSLDRALRVGGWPRGRMIQLAGQEASGKTFLSMKAIADWQSMDPENCACFIDAEYTYDPIWAEKIGIDNDRLILIKTNEAAKIVTGLIGSVKKNKKTGELTQVPGLLGMISEGQVITKKSPSGKELKFNLAKLGIVVLDSIAAVVTPTELESDAGKQNIALVARFLSAELKKLTPFISESNVAFFVINQIRINVGQMFGNPESTNGGRALKHACSVMVNVAPRGSKEDKIFDEKGERIGHKISAKVEKNKVGPAFATAEFWLKFDTGIVNKAEELLEVYKFLNLVERPNNRTYVFGEHKLSSSEEAEKFVTLNYDRLETLLRDYYTNNSDTVICFDNLISLDDAVDVNVNKVMSIEQVEDVDSLFE